MRMYFLSPSPQIPSEQSLLDCTDCELMNTSLTYSYCIGQQGIRDVKLPDLQVYRFATHLLCNVWRFRIFPLLLWKINRTGAVVIIAVTPSKTVLTHFATWSTAREIRLIKNCNPFSRYFYVYLLFVYRLLSTRLNAYVAPIIYTRLLTLRTRLQ